MGKGRRKYFSQRGVSNVISTVILTGLVIALGIATFAWAQGVSLSFIRGFSSVINADIDRLKERLTTEYINYASTSRNVTIYLLNCGVIDDIKIQSTTIRNGTFSKTSQNPNLKLLNGAVVPDLDQRQEGYVEISMGTRLTPGAYYFVTIVTVRGAVFNAEFVA